MKLTTKIYEQDDIRFVRYVMGLSGAEPWDFVRAAVLYYCEYLMRRAHELRQAEQEKTREAADASSTNAERNINTQGALLPANNNVLAQSENNVDDPRRNESAP